jgi:hypothetical protein
MAQKTFATISSSNSWRHQDEKKQRNFDFMYKQPQKWV